MVQSARAAASNSKVAVGLNLPIIKKDNFAASNYLACLILTIKSSLMHEGHLNAY